MLNAVSLSPRCPARSAASFVAALELLRAEFTQASPGPCLRFQAAKASASCCLATDVPNFS